MPTNYTVSVTVAGFGSANYGSMLDGLEIITGSLNPYEFPQPPSARASFIGLPVVSGVTQTPDWWLDKELTFTITPQGATGNVTWIGEVQSYNVSAVEHGASTQIVELELLGKTAKLSTAIIQSEFIGGFGANTWNYFASQLNEQLSRLTWAEAPAGMTWAKVTTTWATYDNNTTGVTVAWNLWNASSGMDAIPSNQKDVLSFVTDVMGNKYKGWMWFDNATLTLNAPSTGYLDYTQLTSLDASSCVLWNSLNASQNLNNIINSADMFVTWNDTPLSYLDLTSYQTWGAKYIDLGDCYEVSTGVPEAVIQNKINAYKDPNKYLQTITIDLDKLTHVTGEWQNFYKSTKPVRLPITNIPAAYGGNHTYMVRGVQLSLTNKHAETTLVVVPFPIYSNL